MYLPPPGRPISTPPDDTPAAEPQKRRRGPHYTAELIAALRADYLAGMPLKDIEAKHGITGGGYRKHFRDLPGRNKRKGKTMADDYPVRLPGESSTTYAGRVMGWKMHTDPEYRAKVVAKRNRTLQRKRLRAARKAALAEQKRLEAELLQPMDLDWQPVPPPSLWQRIIGWFR